MSIHHPLGFNWYPFEGAGIHHLSNKFLGFSCFGLANVKCQTLRMKTHSLSQPSTAYRNRPQLSSTWHSATKVLISSCWILLKLSVGLIYFVHSMVSELSMCLVVLYHHLPSATLGFPWWLLQFFWSRSLHVMKSTSLVARHHVHLENRRQLDHRFHLEDGNMELPILRSMLVGFLSLSQHTKSRSIAKRLEP